MKSNKLSYFKKYNNLQIKKSRKLSNSDKIQQLFNFYSDKKNNRLRDIKYTKIKSNSFSEEKKSSFISEKKTKNKRKFNFISNNNNNTNIKNNISSYNINSNEINKSSSFCVLGRTSDSFMSDINISCNYANYGNACISKLIFNFIKDASMSSFETSKSYKNLKVDKYLNVKMNPIYENSEKFKSEFEKFYSAKHSSLTSINFNDTHQTNKEVYYEKRKKYLLKCVRDIWTRNIPIVLYKRKNKYEKKV